MLSTLDFDVTVPSAYRFLERFAKVDSSEEVVFHFACYLTELPLTDHRMLAYAPSNIAASALYLAHKILRPE